MGACIVKDNVGYINNVPGYHYGKTGNDIEYIVYYDSVNDKIKYTYSTDGSTWTIDVEMTDSIETDYATLLPGSGDVAYVVAHKKATNHGVCLYSLNQGTPTSLWSVDTEYLEPTGTIDASNNVHIIYDRGKKYRMWNGSTISSEEVVSVEDLYLSHIFHDGTNKIVVGRAIGSQDIKYSEDTGGGWSGATMLYDGDGNINGIAGYADSNGDIYLFAIYQGADPGNPTYRNIKRFKRTYSTGNWDSGTLVTTESMWTTATEFSFAKSKDGNVYGMLSNYINTDDGLGSFYRPWLFYDNDCSFIDESQTANDSLFRSKQFYRGVRVPCCTSTALLNRMPDSGMVVSSCDAKVYLHTFDSNGFKKYKYAGSTTNDMTLTLLDKDTLAVIGSSQSVSAGNFTIEDMIPGNAHMLAIRDDNYHIIGYGGVTMSEIV